MRRVALTMLLALGLVSVAAACSSDEQPTADDAVTTTAPTTTTTTAVTTTTTPPTPVVPVSAEVTGAACQAYAADAALKVMRDQIATGEDTSLPTSAVADAFTAVLELEEVAVQPGLDPAVAAAMTLAAEQAQVQHGLWVDTAEIQAGSFDRMLGGVDTACQTAGA